MQVLLAAWLAAVVVLAVPAPAAAPPSWSDHPRTLHVAAHAAAPGDGSATRPYPHIAQAVAVAVAVAGDTVLVGPGRYAEGVRNNVVGNTLTDNAGYGLKVLRRPQGRIAGNTFARNRLGAHEPGAVASRAGRSPSFRTTPFSRRRDRDPLVSNRVVRTPHVLQRVYLLSE